MDRSKLNFVFDKNVTKIDSATESYDGAAFKYTFFQRLEERSKLIFLYYFVYVRK